MTTTSYAKPLPVRDAENAPYWDALQSHAMRLQRCDGGHWRFPVNPVCPVCLSSAFTWEPVSGAGTVYSFVIVHQVYDVSFKEDASYNVAVVELAEGPRLVTNLVNIENAAIRIGLPVRLVYDDITPEFTLAKFEAA